MKRRTGNLRARRYGRVSTGPQGDETKVSLPDQDRTTARTVDYKGWTDLGFVSDKQSGTDHDRPGWLQLVAEARRGEVDVIVCARLDRFARNTLSGLTQIEELAGLNVGLVLCDLDLDTTTPTGKAMLTVLLAFAQLDRDSIVEKLAKGQYGAASLGFWPSSDSAAPFGLRPVAQGKHKVLAIDEDEAATIRKLADLLVDERMELAQACRTLTALGHLPRSGGVWWPENARKVMTSEQRRGVVVWGKEHPEIERFGEPVTIPGVPAVLTDERFRAVVEVLASRRSRPAQAKRVYPLSGRIASPCGRSYIGYGQADRAPRYKCQGSVYSPDPAWSNCHCPRVIAAEVESWTWAQVTEMLSDPARRQQIIEDYLGTADDPAELLAEMGSISALITQRRAALTNQVAGLLRAGVDAQVVKDAAAQVEAEVAELEKRRADLQWLADAAGHSRQEHVLDERLLARLPLMSLEDRRDLLALLEVQVELTEEGYHLSGVLPVLEQDDTGTKVSVGAGHTPAVPFKLAA